MTNSEIAQLITDAEMYLKQTTQGYKQHNATYWANTTTNWYKGLSRLDKAITELRKVVYTFSVVITGTAQKGKTLTATIKVS